MLYNYIKPKLSHLCQKLTKKMKPFKIHVNNPSQFKTQLLHSGASSALVMHRMMWGPKKKKGFSEKLLNFTHKLHHFLLLTEVIGVWSLR